MICFPNAKINLGLNVISKRADGYHNIETVFYPIGLKDALEIIPMQTKARDARNRGYRFFPSGMEIAGNSEDNLVIKAWKVVKKEHDIPPIDIHLLKKIPFGAGLGGGSSDAAFMLKLLNNHFSLGYSEEDLCQRASTIGADCPFFVSNKPAFASGIGEQLEEVALCLDDYFFVLVKPNCFVSTQTAYAMVTPTRPTVSLIEIIKHPVLEWKHTMRNDFEASVFKKFPEICDIKEKLYNLGAIYASMSGSGSSVFALFESETDIEKHFSNQFVWTNKR